LLFRNLFAMPAKDTGKTLKAGVARSGVKSLRGPGFRFGGFLFPISGGGMGLERAEKPDRDRSYLVDRCVKGSFVCLGRFGKAAYFPHVLQGRGTNFVVRYGRVEVE
jgi:hypothetical protein